MITATRRCISIIALLLLVLAFLLPASSASGDETAKNVILFIGDGMGYEEIKAAGMFKNGAPGTIYFQWFPWKASLTTQDARGAGTDSAASATAMATGVKVESGVISVAIPGNGKRLKTALEHFRDDGKSTGLVTTAYISHATTAAFGAHEHDRYRYADIVKDLLRDSRPNVLFGGARHITKRKAKKAGYTVVVDRRGLMALDTETTDFVSGQFGGSHMPYEYKGLGNLPHLSEMTAVALDVLDNDPDGFFLMVESARIDHAGHANNLVLNIHETLEFAKAVKVAIGWAGERDDTLVIVTADHETGGLKVTINQGRGQLPSAKWRTSGHTGVKVPAYAWGAHAHLVNGTIDNTDVFYIMMRAAGLGAE